MFHPASLLLSWLFFAWFLQCVPMPYLLVPAVLALLCAALYAPLRTYRLIWRSRWLLISLAFLFLFFTPGEYLPGQAGRLGISFEGISRAVEHLSLLLAMLAGLALLHERIGTAGILAGLYVLLKPFRRRDVTVVRLMLVLEYAEAGAKMSWKEWLSGEGTLATDPCESPSVSLVVPPLRTRDWLLMGALLTTGLLLWIYA